MNNLAMAWGDPGVRPHVAPPRPAAHLTHEEFCLRVRALAVGHGVREDESTTNLLLGAKLVYGVGSGNYRGVCIYNTWHAAGQSTAVVEIAATGEESPVQLAGTTIHETAHVLAGPGAGHGKDWKDACKRLGLGGPDNGLAMASGQSYDPHHFNPTLWAAIQSLGEPGDGRPTFHQGLMLGGSPLAPFAAPVGACPMGRGVRGGTSMGPGSGRLRLWECGCPRPVKVRVASDAFRAHCDVCGQAFHRK